MSYYYIATVNFSSNIIAQPAPTVSIVINSPCDLALKQSTTITEVPATTSVTDRRVIDQVTTNPNIMPSTSTDSYHIQTRSKLGIFKKKAYIASTSLSSSTSEFSPTPSCFTEAVKNSTWRKAMETKYNALL